METKINWEKILQPYDKEFDEHAKIEDPRFASWLEYSFYRDTHLSGWYNVNRGKSIWEKRFLNEYFEDKEAYIAKVRELGAVVYYINVNQLKSETGHSEFNHTHKSIIDNMIERNKRKSE